MSDQLTCGARLVTAPDGAQIPVPVGGLGLPTGLVMISEAAQVQISASETGGYYVVVNNGDPSNDKASELFVELTREGAFAKLEQLASEAFVAGETIAFKAAGLVVGILASVFTSSKLSREIFIRTSLKMQQPVDGPPVTYCIIV